MKNYKSFLLFLFALCIQNFSLAQDEEEEEDQPKKILSLQYFNNNNSIQYLLLKSIIKKGKVITPVSSRVYELYLDSAGEGNHIATLTTDKTGKAKAFIPQKLKDQWISSGSHTFIVMEGDEEVLSDYMITKSKITLDTITEEGKHSITASVMKWAEEDWVPAPDVEMKLGIKRHGGILTAGEEETYTTDSSGMVMVELIKDTVPGDEKGNYVIAARVDENEELGNLLVESTVPWGKRTAVKAGFFDQRTLWTTRFKAPFWLVGMAFSIIIGVWVTIIYLVFLLIRTIRAGKDINQNKMMEGVISV